MRFFGSWKRDNREYKENLKETNIAPVCFVNLRLGYLKFLLDALPSWGIFFRFLFVICSTLSSQYISSASILPQILFTLIFLHDPNSVIHSIFTNFKPSCSHDCSLLVKVLSHLCTMSNLSTTRMVTTAFRILLILLIRGYEFCPGGTR